MLIKSGQISEYETPAIQIHLQGNPRESRGFSEIQIHYRNSIDFSMGENRSHSVKRTKENTNWSGCHGPFITVVVAFNLTIQLTRFCDF